MGTFSKETLLKEFLLDKYLTFLCYVKWITSSLLQRRN